MTPLSIIDINVDPVLHLGGLSIHWYGVMYALAFWVGLRYGVMPYLERRGIPRAESERLTFWVIVTGLLGARLYYVVQSAPPDGGHWLSQPLEIVAVWHGGMAFFGAMIAAFATVLVLAWRRSHNAWLILDAAALFAVLGQPIGRIGNVINGDILGYQSDLPWATSYSNPSAILQNGAADVLAGRPASQLTFVNCAPFRAAGRACVDASGHPYAYQPAAVYEMLGTILIGVVLWRLIQRHLRAGLLWIVYMELYAVSQFLVFFLRGSEPPVALGLKQAQWTALVVGLVAVPLTALASWRGLGDFSGGRQPGEPVPVVAGDGAGGDEIAETGAPIAAPSRTTSGGSGPPDPAAVPATSGGTDEAPSEAVEPAVEAGDDDLGLADIARRRRARAGRTAGARRDRAGHPRPEAERAP